MNYIPVILGLIFIPLVCLYIYNVGRYKKCGLIGAIVIMIFCTPFFGYFIIEALPLKNPPGCKWCDNKSNEAIYCGRCGKNEAGEVRPK